MPTVGEARGKFQDDNLILLKYNAAAILSLLIFYAYAFIVVRVARYIKLKRKAGFAIRKQNAWLLHIFQGLLMAAMQVGITMLSKGRGTTDEEIYATLAIFTASSIITIPLLLYQFRQNKPLDEATLNSAKEIVLFLRPFTMDNAVFKARIHWKGLIYGKTFEQFFKKALRKQGKCLAAFGNPIDDTIILGGASRVYYPDDNWQDKALNLMDRSRIILLQQGNTESLRWELSQLLQSPERMRKLYMLTPSRQGAFMRWLQTFEDFLRNVPKTNWQKVVRGFAQAGFTLPSDHPGFGSVIQFDEHGHGTVITTGCNTPKAYLKAIEDARSGQLNSAIIPRPILVKKLEPFPIMKAIGLFAIIVFLLSLGLFFFNDYDPEYSRDSSPSNEITEYHEQQISNSNTSGPSASSFENSEEPEVSAIDSSTANNEGYLIESDTIVKATADPPVISSDLSDFIPDGYEVLDTKHGDLNRDAITDAILILKTINEPSQEDAPRPLLLIFGIEGGRYQLLERNNKVVLCKSCGGSFGDPYQNIVIKRGFFSIEHYGGSAMRWTRIITFKYNPSLNTFLLHRDAGASFHASDPDTQEEIVSNRQDYGNVYFSDFRNDK